MKIGLIGAPGSGKSNLAEAIYDTLGLQIIDGYVDALEARSGYVLGRHGSYVMNIAVGIERHLREQEISDGFVTCGTMLDTVTYEAVKVQIAPDEADHRRMTGGLVTLGCMVEDMTDYDHLFLLAHAPEPGEEDPDDFASTVARGLEEAVTIFDVSYTLLEGAFEDRVRAVFAHLREVKT